MATLDDLQSVLESINDSMIEQKDLFSDFFDAQEMRDRLSSVDTTTDPSRNPSNASQTAGQIIGQSAAAGVGGGLGAAGGLIGLGAGIAGFMAALSVGSMGLDWIGADYSGLGDAFASFSDAMENLSPTAAAALAGVAVIAASTASFKNLYGLGTASGMVGLGAGISGFLIGLSLGEIGLSWIGNDYTNLGGALASFSEAIDNLSFKSIGLFGGIAAIAVANTAFRGSPKSLALNMTGLAAGIAGFLGGLVLGDAGLKWITKITGSDGSGLKSAFKLFNNSITELKNPAAIAALGAILVAGTVAGIGKGAGGAGAAIGISAIMTGMGAGISGFMFGLTAGSIGIDWLNKATGLDSSALVGAFRVFNDSISELNNENAIIALGAIIAAGTAGGLATNIGGLGAGLGIAAVMTGIGAGIGGLFLGLTLSGKIIDIIEMLPTGDGLVSAFKMFNDSILTITPDAIARLKELVGLKGLDIESTIKGLSSSVVAMFKDQGWKEIDDMVMAGVRNTVDFIFDTDYAGDAGKQSSIFQQMVDALEPLKDFDVTPVDAFVDRLDSLTNAFQRLATVDISAGIEKNIFKMLKNVGGVLGIMPFLLRGGYYRGEDIGYGDNVDFGEGGLSALKDEDLELLSQQINKIYKALDIPNMNAQGGASATSGAAAVTLPASVENSRLTDSVAAAVAESQLVSINAEQVRIETETATINRFQPQAELVSKPDRDRQGQMTNIDASNKSVNTEYKAGPTYVSNNILQPSHTKNDLDYYFGQ